jgi:hypothetical protein
MDSVVEMFNDATTIASRDKPLSGLSPMREGHI